MTSLCRYSRHIRQDRFSVSVVPEKSRDTEPQSPYLHWLFVENNEDDIYSRLTDTNAEGVDDIDGYSTAEAVIMKEVAAWLELCEHDDVWVAKSKHARKAVLSTTSQLLARWNAADSSLSNTLDGTSAFDAFVKSIALQLLASCYTILPETSANALPLFQQRTGEKSVTALYAHALYRFAPAAGHQARAPSQTSPWPAFYTGPEPEEVLAEIINRRRRSLKQGSDYIPGFAASGWTDGANEKPRRKCSSSSSSSSEADRFAALRCRPSIPKNPRRKNNAACSRLLSCSKGEESGDTASEQPRQKQSQDLRIAATQRIPSTMRTRRSHSVPRMRQSSDPRDSTFEPMLKPTQRPGRDSSTEDSMRYKYDIPAIRRSSLTPHTSQKTKSFLSAKSAGNKDLMSSSDTPGERKATTSDASKLRLGPSHDIGPSPFSAPQAEASDDYFSLESSATHDNGHGEMNADELNARFSSPNYHKIVRNIYNHDKPSFDANGQTAQDGLNDLAFEPQTGHNSQQRSSPPVRDKTAKKPEPDESPPQGDRNHDRLANGTGGMYDKDAEPNPVSDGRLWRLITKRRTSSLSESSDEGRNASGRKGSQEFVVRARRRKSFGYPAGQHDEELVRRFSLTWEEKTRSRQCKELGGEEVRRQ